MERALAETDRRRTKQIEHNEAHGITPKTVKAKIAEIVDSDDESVKAAAGTTFSSQSLTAQQGMAEDQASFKPGGNLQTHIQALEKQMREAAADLDFEKAAELRDEIKKLQDQDLQMA